MSIQIFCVICGTKHEYNLTRPSFCFSCGSPLGNSTLASNQNKTYIAPEVINAQSLHQKASKQQILQEEIEDDDNDIPIPKAGAIEISIPSKRREPIQNLAIGAKVKVEKRGGIVIKTKKQREEFMSGFQKQAGTMTKGEIQQRMNE
ncbi:MAG: hypothetical protein AABY22_05170 [Nanoarchaeota archaeon]